MRILNVVSVLAIISGAPAMSQDIDFGDNTSTWANDGECDDSRFSGPGMTSTPLLDDDIGHDANDCRTAFKAGLLTLGAAESDDLIIDGINFGNDDGQWSNDGECDDPRFAGAGMTTTPLLSDDVLRDASDCSAGYLAGTLTQIGVGADGTIDFGDDNGEWANDSECDDMRFMGPGMTSTPLLNDDIMHDASDCRNAFNEGLLSLVETIPAGPDLVIDGINFGNDDGQWSNDGECDDPRFTGAGMTTTPLLFDDLMRDASDCSAGYEAGTLTLIGIGADGTVEFGDDNGEWAHDSECDDMRFEGPGMTTTPLLNDDIMHDASDCRTAYNAGLLTIAGQ